MTKVGLLEVATSYGDESSSINRYEIVELQIGNEVAVGSVNVNSYPKRMRWDYKLDLSNSTDLDAAFSLMGTNTYDWIDPMTEVGGGNGPVALSGNTNISSITDFGTYYRSTAETTITGIPGWATGTWILEVFPSGIDGQIIQRITTCHKTDVKVGYRAFYLNSWGDWKLDRVNGCPVLWSGASHVNATQTIYLSEAISAQDHGITLVFSPYENNVAVNNNWNSFFVPKTFIDSMPGSYSTFVMSKTIFESVATKSLTINDTSLTGFASNTGSGTGSGISFNNSKWILRYVIGV